jgi:hypothetical protein
LLLKDAWLRKVKTAGGALAESLKLLPLAAMDGDVVYPPSAIMMDALGQADASVHSLDIQVFHGGGDAY